MRPVIQLLIIAAIDLGERSGRWSEIGQYVVAVVATVVAGIVFVSAASCDQSTGPARDSPVSESVPLASVALVHTQPPTPTLTVKQQNRIWEYDINSVLVDSEIWSLLPDIPVSGVNGDSRTVFFGVPCQKDIDRVWQILRKHLPPMGIPLDAVRVEATGYVKPDIYPPVADLFDCYPPEMVDPVTGISSPGFGGLYLESDIAYVYLLEPSQELGEEMVREELGGKEAFEFERIREVRVLEGQFTWEQLWGWYKLIFEGGGLGEGTNIRFAEPVPKENRIKLISWPNMPLLTEKIEEGLLKLGVPREAVIFVNEVE